MPEPFEPLRERLLRGGIAPVHVRRYLRELSDHLADLVVEALTTGHSPTEAKAGARARLGGDDALADAMLAQPSLRSWTSRAPWATLVLGPFVLLFLAWLLACLGIAGLYGWLRHAHGLFAAPAWLQPAWLPKIGAALLDLVQIGAPLLIVSWIARLGARQRSRPVWPLLGCVAVGLFGASLVWQAHWPGPGSRDPTLAVAVRGFYPAPGGGRVAPADWNRGLALGALNLAVAGAVYRMASRRSLA